MAVHHVADCSRVVRRGGAVSAGSHICGAGNGGHVVVFLAAGKTPADVAAAVAGVAEAPEAKVVRVQMMLGGGVRKVGGGRGPEQEAANGVMRGGSFPVASHVE